MKRSIKIDLIIAVIIVLFISVNCSAPNNPAEENDSPQLMEDISFEKSLSEFPITSLNDAEIEGLVFMREEEKLARDVYLKLYETYPLFPFRNISRSEQIHMNAIKILLDRYEIEDPVAEDVKGVFKNEELQNLYTHLTAKGKESEIEALKIGCAIEEIDILDLQSELDENVESPDVKFVYTNLKRASGYHLRAFVWNLKIRGIKYEPQYLDDDAYNDIINPAAKILTPLTR